MGFFNKVKGFFDRSKTDAGAAEQAERLDAKIAKLEAREVEGRPAQLTGEELAAANAAQAEYDAQQVEALRAQIDQLRQPHQPSAEEGDAIGDQMLAQIRGEVPRLKPGKGNIQALSAEAMQNYVGATMARGGREAGLAQGAAETAAIEEANRQGPQPAAFEAVSSAESTAGGFDQAPSAEGYADKAEPGGVVRLEDLEPPASKGPDSAAA